MIVISNLAESISNGLANAGVFLSPKPKSVLEPFVNAMSMAEEIIEEEEIATEGYRVAVNNAMRDVFNPFADTPSLEELAIGNIPQEIYDQAINELKPVVVKMVTTLKDVVLPSVDEIFNKTIEQVKDRVQTGGVKVSVVTDLSEHPIWTNPSVVEMSKLPANYVHEQFPLQFPIRFPDVDVTELKNLIFNADELFNSELTSFIKASSGQSAENVIDDTHGILFRGMSGKIYEDPAKLIIAVILTHFYKTDIPDGLEGIELDEYRRKMHAMHLGYVALLNRKLAMMNDMATDSRLVISYPERSEVFTEGAKVVVNGRLYQQWLANGGDVDFIYGSLAMTHRYYTGEDLIANGQKLINEWTMFIRYAQQSRLDDFQRIYLDALRINIAEYAKENGLTIDSKNVNMLYERISGLTEETVYRFTRKMVIRCLFDNKDYIYIAETIDQIADEEETLDIHDVAQLAIIDWLVKWSLQHVAIEH